MDIAVIGAGYVGLVSAVCLAELGHRVSCVDVDRVVVASLQAGVVPIYEPGLPELLSRNAAKGRLNFTVEYGETVQKADVIFIAVGTPSAANGACDLSQLWKVVREIGSCLIDYYTNNMPESKLLVIKSTVPVGTGDGVKKVLSDIFEKSGLPSVFDVAVNPEFMREGSAVNDFMHPDRIIVGVNNERVGKIMKKVYAALLDRGYKFIIMDIRSAEMTKYTSNAYLATRISFINEIAILCEKAGADIDAVRMGVGSDSRIGSSFLYAGLGYGGSCLPKDVRALCSFAKRYGVELKLPLMAELINNQQKLKIYDCITERFGREIKGRRFAFWGLAFKPQTDDIREAPSLLLIDRLLEAGAYVVAYDPAAAENTRMLYAVNDRVIFAANKYDAIKNCDALCIVTEWEEFRSPDFNLVKKLLQKPLIFDGRNIYDPELMRELGIEYYSVGRGSKPSIRHNT